MANKPYLVIARKWRPQNFEDVVGQEHITRTIQNSIAANRIGHAYLFIGSRGIGKTTTARVLAKALNCESSPGPTPNPCGTCDNCKTIAAGNNIDVIEIDGASNNSVEDVRQIREHIRMVPSRSRYKIYVIDEVHQLSSSAFNALLKTLEEPPEHAVFVLATTEISKVPATIVSRCQRYDFRRVAMKSITTLLKTILDAEGIGYSEEALYAIARAADGGIRDAESILEQVISYADKEVTYEDVYNVLGLVDWRVLHEFCEAILSKDVASLLRLVERIVAEGKDLSQFVQDILQYFRNLLVCKTTDPAGLLALPDNEIEIMKTMSERFTLTGLIRMVEQFAELAKDFDSQLAQRIALESLLIRISKVAVEMSVDTVLEKLVQLGAGGIDSGGPERPFVRGAAAPVKAPASGSAAPEAEIEATPSNGTKRTKVATVTDDNLRTVWPRLTHQFAERDLNLGIALGHAIPIRIEGDALVLRFSERQERSQRAIERQENLATIATFLKASTSNITGLRCETEPEIVGDDAPNRRHFTGHVSTEEAKAALADPHVAKVVELFRGRIVDIKHGAGSEVS